MQDRLIHSHGLQRALAKPSQLHSLCAATGKGERETSCAPSPVCCPRGGRGVSGPGRAGKEPCPVLLRGQLPREVSSIGSSLSV